MTGKEFDRTIKDKTEQAHYPFKEAAWDIFSSKSGHSTTPRFTRLHKALAVTATSLITAGIVSGILLHVNNTHTEPQMPVETADTDSSNVIADTLTLEMPTQEETANSKDKSPAVANTNYKSPETGKNKVVAISVAGDTLFQGTDKNQTKPVPKRARAAYGRPLEINVDTITDMEPTYDQLRKGNSRLF